MRRPLGVTIVGVLIILIAAFGVLSIIHASVNRPAAMELSALASLAGDRVPTNTRHAVGFLTGAVEFIAGFLILGGWEMGRTIYVAIGAIALVFAFVTSPLGDPLWLGLVLFGVFVFVLYQPESSQWFRRSDARVLRG